MIVGEERPAQRFGEHGHAQVLFPPPRAGEGQGGARDASSARAACPHPNPPPHAGEGAEAPWRNAAVMIAARAMSITLEYRFLLLRKCPECAGKIVGLHAQRLRHRLRLDR